MRVRRELSGDRYGISGEFQYAAPFMAVPDRRLSLRPGGLLS
jgi:hypothetical protein